MARRPIQPMPHGLPPRLLAPVIVMVCALAACSSTPDGPAGPSKNAPEWVRTGTSAKYSTGAYLVGMGSADYTGDLATDSALAAERARADILGQLVTEVKSEYFRRAAEFHGAEGVVNELESVQRIETKVAGSLPVQPEHDRYHDRDAGRVYVLLAVSRRGLADTLAARIAELTGDHRAALDEARGHTAKGRGVEALRMLPRLRAMIPAWRVLVAERDALLGKPDSAMQTPLTAEALTALRDSASAAVSVRLDAPGAAATALPRLSEILSAAGLSQNNGKATHTLLAGVDADERREAIGGETATSVTARWKLTLSDASGAWLFAAGSSDPGMTPARGVVLGKDARVAREKALAMATEQMRAALKGYLEPAVEDAAR